MNERVRQFILLFGDVAILYLSLFIALSIRNKEIISVTFWMEHVPIFTYAFLIWVLVLYISGSYTPSYNRNDLRFFVITGQSMAINILLAIAVFYIVPYAALAPKTILVFTGLIFYVLFVVWRYAVYRPIFSNALTKYVIMIGNNPAITQLTGILDHYPEYGYRVAAVLNHNARDQVGNVPDYRDPQQLNDVIKKHEASLVVMDHESKASPELINNLYHHLGKRLEFMSLDYFFETITKRISLDTIDQFWFLENLQEGKKRLYDIGKRALDIVISLVGLAFSLVVGPMVAFSIVVTDGMPVFFTQTRLGKNGKSFRAIKFRTMIANAEKNGPQWASRNDPRVTGVGTFLRKTRLDEIPQLWNILKGEMSFVGPRPERPEFVAQLEKKIPFYRERLLIKPGLTGWAQINFPYGASEDDALKKLQYDLYYVKNRSLVLDCAIILRTIKTVISGVGQ